MKKFQKPIDNPSAVVYNTIRKESSNVYVLTSSALSEEVNRVIIAEVYFYDCVMIL